MPDFRIDVVSSERNLFSGQATAVLARSVEGEIQILARHQPALLALDDAALSIDLVDGERAVYAVHGGFLFYREDRLVILADLAEPVDEIDIERARAAKSRAEEALAREETVVMRAALDRAETRLKVTGAA